MSELYERIPDYPLTVREADIVAVVEDANDSFYLLMRGGHRIHLGDDVVVDGIVALLERGDGFLDIDKIRAHQLEVNERVQQLEKERAAKTGDDK